MQLPLQPPTEAVELAVQLLEMARVGIQQASSAVQAAVCQRTQLSILAANDNPRIPENVVDHGIAWLCHLLFAASHLPYLGPKSLCLEFEKSLRRISRCFQRRCSEVRSQLRTQHAGHWVTVRIQIVLVGRPGATRISVGH